MYGGKSRGGVVLIVHDRVHCWARGLLSTWWRLKEVCKALERSASFAGHVTVVWSFGVIRDT